MNPSLALPRFNADGSENVIYDFEDFPIYVRRDPLSACENYRYEAHFHGDWEFIIALSGQMQFRIDGDTVTIPEGAGLFVNAGHIHFGFSEKKEECEYICLLAPPSLFCVNPLIEQNYVQPLSADQNQPYALLPPGNAAVKAITLINSLRETGDPDYLLHVQTGLFTVLEALSALQKKNPVVALPKRNFTEMKRMLEYIERRYAEKITLDDIAGAGHVSKNTCINIFQLYVGDSPVSFLRSYRLQQSRPLLKNTELSVSQIAYEVGFSGASYFAEAFKAAYGMSPHTYRVEINT